MTDGRVSVGADPEGADEAGRFLRIYLNDHWAGQAAGRKLAERLQASNRDTPLGQYASDLLSEIQVDAELLQEAMRRVGAKRDVIKEVAVLTFERIGRLKPNGRVLSYSPLSRVVELEAMALGVEGKLSLWKVLAKLGEGDDRLRGLDFGAAQKRARSQRSRLERFRTDAARLAFEAKGS